MKMRLFILTFLASISITNAQTAPPQGITYQAVAIDENGKEIVGVDAQGIPISSRAITIRFSIIRDNVNGIIDYSEEHITNTDKYGLFTVIIGQGNPLSAKLFNEINWGVGPKFLKVELDLNGNGDFNLSSIQQMMSVPYSLYAQKTSMSDTAAYAYASPAGDTTSQIQFLGINGDSLSITKGNSIDLSHYLDTGDYQTLSIVNDSLIIDNGNAVDLLPYVNVPQTLSLINDTLSILNGNSVDLSKYTDTPQNLFFNNDTLSISSGNSIYIPVSYKDTSETNELQDLILNNDTLSLTKSGTKVHIKTTGTTNNLSPNNAYIQDACYYSTSNLTSFPTGLSASPVYQDSLKIIFHGQTATNTSVEHVYWHWSKAQQSFYDTVTFNFNNLTPLNNNWYAFGTYRNDVYFFQVGGTIFGYDTTLTLLYGGSNPTPTGTWQYFIASQNFAFAYNSAQTRKINISNGQVTTITTQNPGPSVIYKYTIGDDFVLSTQSAFQNSTVWRNGTSSYTTVSKNWRVGFRVDTCIIAVRYTSVSNNPFYNASYGIYLLDTNYNEIKDIASFRANNPSPADPRIGVHSTADTVVFRIITELPHTINGKIISIPYTQSPYELLFDVSKFDWTLDIKEVRPLYAVSISYLIEANNLFVRLFNNTGNSDACLNGVINPANSGFTYLEY